MLGNIFLTLLIGLIVVIILYVIFSKTKEQYKSSLRYFMIVSHKHGLPSHAILDKQLTRHSLILHFEDEVVLIDEYISPDVAEAARTAESIINIIYKDKVRNVTVASFANMVNERFVTINFIDDK